MHSTHFIYGYIVLNIWFEDPFKVNKRGNLQPQHELLIPINSKSFICTIPDRIVHTSAFVTPVVEWQAAQCVYHEESIHWPMSRCSTTELSIASFRLEVLSEQSSRLSNHHLPNGILQQHSCKTLWNTALIIMLGLSSEGVFFIYSLEK